MHCDWNDIANELKMHMQVTNVGNTMYFTFQLSTTYSTCISINMFKCSYCRMTYFEDEFLDFINACITHDTLQ